MKLLGIDPGGTTGLCIVDTKKITRPYGMQSRYLYPHLGGWITDADLIVMETVVAHGSLSQGKIDQIKAVGAVEYLAELYRVCIVWITPENRKVAERLVEFKDSNWNDVPAPHSRDAFYLTVAYALKEGLIELDDAKPIVIKG